MKKSFFLKTTNLLELDEPLFVHVHTGLCICLLSAILD